MKTARASRIGLSNPTVQMKKGRASERATGSTGIFSHIAMGSDIRAARKADETMADGSQKLDPSWREREARMKKVAIIRM